jgi:hypothetical protein
MTADSPQWTRVEYGTGGTYEERPTDPKVTAGLPSSTRAYISVGVIESAVRDLKRLFHRDPDIPL